MRTALPLLLPPLVALVSCSGATTGTTAGAGATASEQPLYCTGMFSPQDAQGAFDFLTGHAWDKSYACSQGKWQDTCVDHLELHADGTYVRRGHALASSHDLAGRWSFGLDVDHPKNTSYKGNLCLESGGATSITRLTIRNGKIELAGGWDTPYAPAAALEGGGGTLDALPPIGPPEAFRVLVGSAWRRVGAAAENVPDTVTFDPVGHWSVDATGCRNSGDMNTFEGDRLRTNMFQAMEQLKFGGIGICYLEWFKIDVAARKLSLAVGADLHTYAPED